MPDLAKTCPPLAGIIISADDFGKNPTTNANILKLLELKKLGRISIMVDENLSPEEIRQLLDSRVKLDLHLVFFNLLGSSQQWRKKTGAFARLLVFCKDYLSGKISASRIGDDWARQLEKFRAIFGRYPDGLNSHEHIHLFPPYFKLILALMEKKGIKYLRFGKKDFLQADNFVSLVIFGLKKINRRRFLATGLDSTDFLISLDWLKEEALREINPHTKGLNCPTNRYAKHFGVGVKNLSSGEIELVIHPERTAEMETMELYTPDMPAQP